MNLMNHAILESLQGAEAIWIAAWESLNAEHVVGCFAPDAVMLTASRPPIRGRAEILQALAPLFGMPGFSTSLSPLHAEVAEAGDLGYTYGEYESRFTDAAGKAVGHDGHYAAVWKKNSAGDWRIVLYSAHPRPRQ